MEYTINRVSTDEDIAAVAALADVIWREHFIPIIGEPQVEYMLDKFQSPPVIASQLSAGAVYYLALVEEQPAGYIGLIPDRPNSSMMISKLYVKRDTRGAGLGGRLLELVENQCASQSIDTIWLTVNRFNHGPVAWYRNRGFVVIDEVRKDIGHGFYMDDFIMQKKLR